MEYTPTIGLEIHAELKTNTKMFCDSVNDPEEKRPNINVCEVCMAHPGTLPTINQEAVKHMLKIGYAIEGQCADFTEFDRKNYFYPDIPKGYQISQYAYPLVAGGTLNGVTLTRIHLEEDTARSTHERGDYSLVDFNRAGIPLMELVTEPDIKTGTEAGAFARELQLLLRYLGVSDANMEKGEMRVEANVSVSAGSEKGTKVEVKNLNSFRSVERAIAYEIERQASLLDQGKAVMQETRGWDEAKQETYAQRVKEEAHDYRYFPDPDLPKLVLSELPEFAREEVVKEMPELPWERRARLQDTYHLAEHITGLFVNEKELGDFFEAVVTSGDERTVTLAANYISSDLPGIAEEGDWFGHITTKGMRELIEMIKESKISSRGAKELLSVMYQEGGSPKKLAEERGLFQQSDEGAVQQIVDKVIADNTQVAEDYKNGKDTALKFLVGQVMKESKGSANPQVAQELLKKTLNE